MEPKKNFVDQFFDDLPGEDKTPVHIFDENQAGSDPEKVKNNQAGDTSNSGEPHKNRRHRRLEEQLQREKEARIAAESQNKAYREAQEFSKSTNGEVDPRLLEIFGTNDDGKRISQNFSNLLKEERKIARDEAIKEMESRQAQSRKEEQEYGDFITTELEKLEDEHNVDLTSDAPAARKNRREFLELVQNLSPKDETGTITGFADFHTSYELYSSTKKENKNTATIDRKKEIAGGSMQRSGGEAGSSAPRFTPGFKGWKRDLNIR